MLRLWLGLGRDLFELVGGEGVFDRLLQDRNVDDDRISSVVTADDLSFKSFERAGRHDDLIAAPDAGIDQDFFRLREDLELVQGIQLANQRVFLVRFAKEFDVDEFLNCFFQLRAFLIACGKEDVARDHQERRDDFRPVVQASLVCEWQINGIV